jgi:TusA-related sulfurtransferase
MSESVEKKLDATGLFCPEPVFRTKIEIERMQVGEIITVSADDPAAEEDISRWVTRNGHELLDLSKDGVIMSFQIKKVKLPKL